MCLERRRGPRDLLGERASRNSAGPLPSVDVSVSFRCLSSSLPPTCPRTRLKDAKTRPLGPGCDARFLAF
jgi:hypothetical protein